MTVPKPQRAGLLTALQWPEGNRTPFVGRVVSKHQQLESFQRSAIYAHCKDSKYLIMAALAGLHFFAAQMHIEVV